MFLYYWLTIFLHNKANEKKKIYYNTRLYRTLILIFVWLLFFFSLKHRFEWLDFFLSENCTRRKTYKSNPKKKTIHTFNDLLGLLYRHRTAATFLFILVSCTRNINFYFVCVHRFSSNQQTHTKKNTQTNRNRLWRRKRTSKGQKKRAFKKYRVLKQQQMDDLKILTKNGFELTICF